MYKHVSCRGYSHKIIGCRVPASASKISNFLKSTANMQEAGGVDGTGGAHQAAVVTPGSTPRNARGRRPLTAHPPVIATAHPPNGDNGHSSSENASTPPATPMPDFAAEGSNNAAASEAVEMVPPVPPVDAHAPRHVAQSYSHICVILVSCVVAAMVSGGPVGMSTIAGLSQLKTHCRPLVTKTLDESGGDISGLAVVGNLGGMTTYCAASITSLLNGGWVAFNNARAYVSSRATSARSAAAAEMTLAPVWPPQWPTNDRHAARGEPVSAPPTATNPVEGEDDAASEDLLRCFNDNDTSGDSALSAEETTGTFAHCLRGLCCIASLGGCHGSMNESLVDAVLVQHVDINGGGSIDSRAELRAAHRIICNDIGLAAWL
jgi:hypothetical protein